MKKHRDFSFDTQGRATRIWFVPLLVKTFHEFELSRDETPRQTCHELSMFSRCHLSYLFDKEIHRGNQVLPTNIFQFW